MALHGSRTIRSLHLGSDSIPLWLRAQSLRFRCKAFRLDFLRYTYEGKGLWLQGFRVPNGLDS